jgi:ligand-binding sensor domain-containing protein
MTFIPATGSISSLEVMDISESHDGMVAFATTNGLSLYDSGWATIQKEPWNYDTGLQDDFIQTIEFDDKNYLWLGFSAGVQKYDGISFTRVGKDEFFSTMNIHDILCDNNTIWIANGYSGLNHLSEGGWNWIRPFTEDGPGAYYITSMAKDHATGDIILTSRSHGIWKGVSDEEGIHFSPIPIDEEHYGKMTTVVDYPFGGVILFNKNIILHYSESAGFSRITDTTALGPGVIRINDVAVTEEGTFVIGTNNGLYGYDNSEIIVHITRNILKITSNEVTKVYPDSKGRWWFITKGEAGYYFSDNTTEKIPVAMVNESVSEDSGMSEPSAPIRLAVHYVSDPL